MVHVSTAFNNLDREELDEVIYPATVDPIKLIELIDCLDDGLVRAITKEYEIFITNYRRCLKKQWSFDLGTLLVMFKENGYSYNQL